MEQIEAEGWARRIGTALADSGIEVRDISYAHDQRDSKDVRLKVAACVPDKALILVVSVGSAGEGVKIHFQAKGQAGSGNDVESNLILPRGYFHSWSSSGIFSAVLSLKPIGPTNKIIESEISAGIAWFRLLAGNPAIIAKFREVRSILVAALVDDRSQEYAAAEAEHKEDASKTICAKVLVKFPARIFSDGQLIDITKYAD